MPSESSKIIPHGGEEERNSTVEEQLGKQTKHSGSKYFHGTEDNLLCILDSVTRAETTQLQHMVLVPCSLGDTVLAVHTPEPGNEV